MPSKSQRSGGKNNHAVGFKLTHYVSFFIPEEENECREAIKTRLDWIGTGSSKLPKKGKSVWLEISANSLVCDQPIWWEDTGPNITSIPFSQLHEIYIMKKSSKKLILDVRSEKLNERRLVYFEAKNSSQAKALVDNIRKQVAQLETAKNEVAKEEERKLKKKENSMEETSPKDTYTSPKEILLNDTVTQAQSPSPKISPVAKPKPVSVIEVEEDQLETAVSPRRQENHVTNSLAVQTPLDLNLVERTPSGMPVQSKIIIPRESMHSTANAHDSMLPDYCQVKRVSQLSERVSRTSGPEYLAAPSLRLSSTPIRKDSTIPVTSVLEFVPGLNRNEAYDDPHGKNIRILFENVPLGTRTSSGTSTYRVPGYDLSFSGSQTPPVRIAANDFAPRSAQDMFISNRQATPNTLNKQSEHVITPRKNPRAGSAPSNTLGYPKQIPQKTADRRSATIQQTNRNYYTIDRNQYHQINRPLKGFSDDTLRASPKLSTERYVMEPEPPRFSSRSHVIFDGNNRTQPQNDVHFVHPGQHNQRMSHNIETYKGTRTESPNFYPNVSGSYSKNVLLTYQKATPENDHWNPHTSNYQPEYARREGYQPTHVYRDSRAGYH